MHPNLMNLYAIELQLKYERTLLNLTAEERLIRKAKLAKNSGGIIWPAINLQGWLAALGKHMFQRRKADNITLQTEVNCC